MMKVDRCVICRLGMVMMMRKEERRRRKDTTEVGQPLAEEGTG